MDKYFSYRMNTASTFTFTYDHWIMQWENNDSHYYAVNSGNSLLTFQDNLLVSSSRVKNSKRTDVLICNWDYAYANEFLVTV